MMIFLADYFVFRSIDFFQGPEFPFSIWFATCWHCCENIIIACQRRVYYISYVGCNFQCTSLVMLQRFYSSLVMLQRIYYSLVTNIDFCVVPRRGRGANPRTKGWQARALPLHHEAILHSGRQPMEWYKKPLFSNVSGNFFLKLHQ